MASRGDPAPQSLWLLVCSNGTIHDGRISNFQKDGNIWWEHNADEEDMRSCGPHKVIEYARATLPS